jgi:D-alanyl-D-alanine-carboxypeptidase/D-alanyl-D-alanine-endopeptidase
MHIPPSGLLSELCAAVLSKLAHAAHRCDGGGLRAQLPAILIPVMAMTSVAARPVLAQDAAVLVEVDRTMENYRLDAHIPGMVWGIVQDGRLVHLKGAGVQDIDAKRPVTADTLFRIASMTKAFTALSIL